MCFFHHGYGYVMEVSCIIIHLIIKYTNVGDANKNGVIHARVLPVLNFLMIISKLSLGLVEYIGYLISTICKSMVFCFQITTEQGKYMAHCCPITLQLSSLLSPYISTVLISSDLWVVGLCRDRIEMLGKMGKNGSKIDFLTRASFK